MNPKIVNCPTKNGIAYLCGLKKEPALPVIIIVSYNPVTWHYRQAS